MIALGDIVEIHVPARIMPRIWDDAEQASIGGKSNIRPPGPRIEWMSEDQLSGLLVQWTYTWWSTGSDEKYIRTRDLANANRYEGDDGDIAGLKLDTKGSRMRTQPDPLKYRLAVRPPERHVGWAYILGLIRDWPGCEQDPAVVLLIGWALEHELPDVPDQEWKFKGAYTIMAPELRPMSEGDHPYGLPEEYC